VWAAKPLFRTAAKDFGKAVASLEALEKSEALKYGTGEDYHRFHVVLRNIKYRLLGGEPKLVCPLCEGERIEGCERCGGKGWLSIADESKLAENRPASRK
jgi:hypothetical protein